jgi:hypothetical protein
LGPVNTSVSEGRIRVSEQARAISSNKSIWLGLTGRTNMSRIILFWIENSLLKP